MRCLTLLSFLVIAAPPSSHPVEAPLCGLPQASPSIAWIDVPVFWINVDRAVERAASMRSQLAVTLLPGACAQRVSAVTIDEVASVASGGFLFLPDGELRFRSPTKKIVIATTLSHLKALHLGLRAMRARTPRSQSAYFLVLEDDVDLLFFPSAIGGINPKLHLAKTKSLRAFGNSLPAGWSIALLTVILVEPLRRAWSRDGLGSNRSVVAMSSLTLKEPDGTQRPGIVWGAAGYLASKSFASEMASIWPVVVSPIAGSQAGTGTHGAPRFMLNIARACWVKARWHVRKERHARREHELMFAPNFGVDHCLTQHESYGPALTEAEARSRGQRVFFPSAGRHTTGQAFIATPPLMTLSPAAADSSATHANNSPMRTANAAIREWWKDLAPPSR